MTRPYSLRRALTSSHNFLRSVPLGPFPFTPFPFPDRIPSVVSNSFFTSFAKFAWRTRQDKKATKSEDMPDLFE